jgi:hypothetical protein
LVPPDGSVEEKPNIRWFPYGRNSSLSKPEPPYSLGNVRDKKPKFTILANNPSGRFPVSSINF